jgi:MOSC domain-containing protein YiiM
MRIVSIQVGRPREVAAAGRSSRRAVISAIFKQPVAGRVMLRALNLDGDQQADLRVHGGAEKAVYVYPVEHYPFWRVEYPELELPYGMFGENLTSEGLLEDEVCIGDLLRIGGAEVVVTQPRMPCYKLGIRFGREDILKRFLRSRRTGWYCSVAREGEIGAGDAIERLSRDPQGITISDITRLYAEDRRNLDLLRRALAVPALAAVWRELFQERLDKLVG